MKKIISVLLALIMVFGTGAVAFAENQTSVPEGYIGIYTAEDLYNIRNNLSGKYILMNDIDLSVYENWEPIGTLEEPFTGELDGNGYVILNMSIYDSDSVPGTHCFGLLGRSSGSNIKNIILYDAYINVSYPSKTDAVCYASAIIGYGSLMDDISGCSVTGALEVSGYSTVEAGAIIGKNIQSCPVRCSNYAEINVFVPSTAKQIFVGGISGSLALKETELANFGSISVSGDDVNSDCVVKLGGIDGEGSEGMSLSDSYNRGNISIDFSTPQTYMGGISGESKIIENVYNSGEISMPDNSNGFVGSISGNIYSSWFGVGNPKKIENAYYVNQNMIPAYNAESVPESFNKKPYVNVKYSDFIEMKSESTFVGFDFEEIWTMEENGYPVLKNQPTVCVEESIELVEGDVYNDKIITSEWSTTNPDVATVNENGEIVAVGVGEATITVKYAYGYTEEITVNVIGEVEVPEPQKSLFEMIVDFIKGLFERIIDFILCIFSLEKLI